MKRLLWLPAWLLFMACLFTGTAWGQVPYRGHVVDGVGQAVAYATVVLLAGERQVSGTITDEAGDFVLESFTGQYQLVIRYAPYWNGNLVVLFYLIPVMEVLSMNLWKK